MTITTVRDATRIASNTIANLTHGPRELISFHSQIVPLHPDDILSTGAPGAAVIEDVR